MPWAAIGDPLGLDAVDSEGGRGGVEAEAAPAKTGAEVLAPLMHGLAANREREVVFKQLLGVPLSGDAAVAEAPDEFVLPAVRADDGSVGGRGGAQVGDLAELVVATGIVLGRDYLAIDP